MTDSTFKLTQSSMSRWDGVCSHLGRSSAQIRMAAAGRYAADECVWVPVVAILTAMHPSDEEADRRFASWKHCAKLKDSDQATDSPQQVYSELMKSAFAPALRQVGLRGSAGRFELPSDRFWAQLGFQKSAYSDGHEVRFTVNLSVIDRDEWNRQIQDKPYLGTRPTPSTHYGPWAEQVRIGKITPGGEDKWWRIVQGLDPGPAAKEAVSDLLTYGVPWLRARTA